jgi:hypothetical protein
MELTRPNTWDDFKGVDVKGKLLVVLVNDPDFEGGEGDFGGKAMTYYGRWTYKYEKPRGGAGRPHITRLASLLRMGRSRTQHEHPVRYRPPEPRASPPFETWIQLPLAQQIFAASGLNFAQAKKRPNTATSSRSRSRRR